MDVLCVRMMFSSFLTPSLSLFISLSLSPSDSFHTFFFFSKLKWKYFINKLSVFSVHVQCCRDDMGRKRRWRTHTLFEHYYYCRSLCWRRRHVCFSVINNESVEMWLQLITRRTYTRSHRPTSSPSNSYRSISKCHQRCYCTGNGYIVHSQADSEERTIMKQKEEKRNDGRRFWAWCIVVAHSLIDNNFHITRSRFADTIVHVARWRSKIEIQKIPNRRNAHNAFAAT